MRRKKKEKKRSSSFKLEVHTSESDDPEHKLKQVSIINRKNNKHVHGGEKVREKQKEVVETCELSTVPLRCCSPSRRGSEDVDAVGV